MIKKITEDDNFYPYYFDAKTKPERSEDTLFKLGDENAAVDIEVFVRVPYMKQNRFDGGEHCLTIHPYFLFNILVSNECYHEFIENKNTELIGYTTDDLLKNSTHHFSDTQYFVSEKLFSYISLLQTVDNRTYSNWLLPNSAYDYDGDYEKTLDAYLRLNDLKSKLFVKYLKYMKNDKRPLED